MVTARLRYLRIAPRKVRMVADIIRGKSVEEAQNILNFTVKKSVNPLGKLLNSAIASARNNFQLDPSSLYISKITIDEGPKYKRFMPRARGQAYEIQKKTSHITLVLSAKGGKAKKLAKSEEIGKSAYAKAAADKAEKPRFKTPEKEILRPKTGGAAKKIFKRQVF